MGKKKYLIEKNNKYGLTPVYVDENGDIEFERSHAYPIQDETHPAKMKYPYRKKKVQLSESQYPAAGEEEERDDEYIDEEGELDFPDYTEEDRTRWKEYYYGEFLPKQRKKEKAEERKVTLWIISGLVLVILILGSIIFLAPVQNNENDSKSLEKVYVDL